MRLLMYVCLIFVALVMFLRSAKPDEKPALTD